MSQIIAIDTGDPESSLHGRNIDFTSKDINPMVCKNLQSPYRRNDVL